MNSFSSLYLDIIVTLLFLFDKYLCQKNNNFCQKVYEICQNVANDGQNDYNKIQKNSSTQRIKEFSERLEIVSHAVQEGLDSRSIATTGHGHIWLTTTTTCYDWSKDFDEVACMDIA